MSPVFWRRVSLLALLLLGIGDQSHAKRAEESFPRDALAFPEFETVFQGSTINNSTALKWLGLFPPSTDVRSSTTEVEQWGQEEPWAEGAEYELYRASPKENYLCRYPSFVELRALDQQSKKRQLSGDEEARILRTGLELLEPMRGRCIYQKQGWFTYAFCYGDKVRQYRADEKQILIKLSGDNTESAVTSIDQQDETQPAFVLGRWSQELEPSESARAPSEPGSPGSELAPASDVGSSHWFVRVNGVLEGQQACIKQVWTSGTICDMNGLPRTIEVQYFCAENRKDDRIMYIKEVTTCNYIIAIQTPRLCKEPAFRDRGEKPKQSIHCRLITPDDVEERNAYVAQVDAQHGHAQAAMQGETDYDVAEEYFDATDSLDFGEANFGAEESTGRGPEEMPPTDESMNDGDNSHHTAQEGEKKQPNVKEARANPASITFLHMGMVTGDDSGVAKPRAREQQARENERRKEHAQTKESHRHMEIPKPQPQEEEPEHGDEGEPPRGHEWEL